MQKNNQRYSTCTKRKNENYRNNCSVLMRICTDKKVIWSDPELANCSEDTDMINANGTNFDISKVFNIEARRIRFLCLVF